ALGVLAVADQHVHGGPLDSWAPGRRYAPGGCSDVAHEICAYGWAAAARPPPRRTAADEGKRMGASTSRADPVARARELARIRDAVLTGSAVPEQPRPVVSESWRRSLAAHVDPESGAPPSVFDRREVAELRAGHPLAETLPLLRETLVAIADEAMHMMIVTDARGHILWCEGQGGVLRRAEDVGLAVGTRWSEDAIGTNAMGTALAEQRAVQIHSAEHLVRTYHE